MPALVDSSVWIDYFRSGENSASLDFLIDENLLVTNDIILTELIPFLQIKNLAEIIRLLRTIQKLPLQIDWEEIIQFQTKCLQGGVNGVGIPDLLIAQNARQNQCVIYTLDKHFQLIQQIIDIELLETEL